MSREIVLAIETGISNGSLSILKSGSELDYWIGDKKISRSEDLLSNITKLFSKNKIGRLETKRIAVSTGPGSFTGVRIGIATAMGLSKALRCECVGIPVLGAIASQFTERAVVAFGVGENEACWQIFDATGANQVKRSIDQPKVDLISDFAERLKKYPQKVLILTRDLHGKMKENNWLPGAGDFDLIKSVDNPAKYVGLGSEEITLTSCLLPLYTRDVGIS